MTFIQICWENTTAALCRGQMRPGMVKELDPDAPNRNGLVLHELDVEDDTKLLSCMMNLVRCGLLDEAQVCYRYTRTAGQINHDNQSSLNLCPAILLMNLIRDLFNAHKQSNRIYLGTIKWNSKSFS